MVCLVQDDGDGLDGIIGIDWICGQKVLSGITDKRK